MPQTIFRLYNQLDSTVFSFLGKDREVQQTKGLALVLAKDWSFLERFLNIPGLREKLLEGKKEKTVSIENFERIVVHAEMEGKDGSGSRSRIDICILLHGKTRRESIAVIIEAKGATVRTRDDVCKQLSRYVASEGFPWFRGFGKEVGVTITKNQIFTKDSRFATLIWEDIVRVLPGKRDDSAFLTNDYLGFLTNINGFMKFYEKEVYSIPAGKSHELIVDDPFIYECPNSSQYQLKMTPLYLAFRQGKGGEMDKLFGLERIIILNPRLDLESFLSSDDEIYSKVLKRRIEKYCEKTWPIATWPQGPPNEEKQFFVLSETNQITLKHQPCPSRNNPFRGYYRLADLLEGKKIVRPESKTDPTR